MDSQYRTLGASGTRTFLQQPSFESTLRKDLYLIPEFVDDSEDMHVIPACYAGGHQLIKVYGPGEDRLRASKEILTSIMEIQC
jgi:hypothetical protein